MLPSETDSDHINMGIEVHTGAWFWVFMPRHDIHSWVLVAVAGSALCPIVFDLKVSPRQSVTEELGAICVIFPWWINRWNLHQIASEFDEFITFICYPFEQ